MATVPLPGRMSIPEYLEFEQDPDQPRHEYADGEVFEMEAATRAHAELVARIGGLLDGALRSRCKVYTGLRVYATRAKFLYPDVAVICGEQQVHSVRVEDDETIENPCLLVEVRLVSEDASFTEYLLVSQWERLIEYRSRTSEGDWLSHLVEEGYFALHHLDIGLVLEDIYHDIVPEAAIL